VRHAGGHIPTRRHRVQMHAAASPTSETAAPSKQVEHQSEASNGKGAPLPQTATAAYATAAGEVLAGVKDAVTAGAHGAVAKLSTHPQRVEKAKEALGDGAASKAAAVGATAVGGVASLVTEAARAFGRECPPCCALATCMNHAIRNFGRLPQGTCPRPPMSSCTGTA